MPKKIQKRVCVSFLLLLLIGITDWLLSFEVKMAVFYLFPIVIFSYQNSIALKYSCLFSLCSLFVWGFIDFKSYPYSDNMHVIINLLSRGILFLASAVIANRFFIEKEQREIISSQKKAIETSYTELQEINEKMNRLLGVAAHDIRNPVGAIQTMSELLLDDPAVVGEIKDLIGLIHTSSKNSLQILNHMLHISQIQSGIIELHIFPMDYILFIQECIALNNHLASRKHQKINFVSSISSVEARFDKVRLLQVINNLLTNAIKYSEINKTIIVKVSYADDNFSAILTEVIDNGLGIEKQEHARVFDAFITGSARPTNNESQTGLGLAIAKKIVELHNGTIGFTSEPGKGSDFFFTLPMT